MNESVDVVKAVIPLPVEAYVLNGLFKKFNIKIFAVGGAVRDYWHMICHNPTYGYSPKDVDLATESAPELVFEALSSYTAAKLGITVFPKGMSFGVISAVLNGKEYEIATFREEWYDPESGDGRRPDKVCFSTPAKDASRRDLTINALFYDIDAKEIHDYNVDQNGKGQGLQDIKNKIARPVGNPYERFREDKLRVLRLMRFYAKYNSDCILENLDSQTLNAIKEFKDLKGISNERIAAEFLAGIKNAANTESFISNYDDMGLFSTVFPNLTVSKATNELHNCKNVNVVLAWILRHNNPQTIKKELIKLKYSREVSNSVSFLIDLINFDPKYISRYLKHRDLYLQLDEPERSVVKNKLEKDIFNLSEVKRDIEQIQFFMLYKSPVKSEDFMYLTGAEMGQAMNLAEITAFEESYRLRSV